MTIRPYQPRLCSSDYDRHRKMIERDRAIQRVFWMGVSFAFVCTIVFGAVVGMAWVSQSIERSGQLVEQATQR